MKELWEGIKQLFGRFGWVPALIVIVVLVALATFVLWFLDIDITELWS